MIESIRIQDEASYCSIPKTKLYKVASQPGGSLDAENACGLTGKFVGGASDLDRWTTKITIIF